MVVDPMCVITISAMWPTSFNHRGTVLAEADEGESIIHVHIGSCHSIGYWKPTERYTDSAALEDARAGIPVTMQRRFDVYPDVSRSCSF
jgi:hypothetical protein